MRIFSIIIIFFSILWSTGCGNSGQINGRSFSTALKSVKMIKGRLPQEKRIAFELSFWAIRTAYRKNSQFLDKVGGTTPDELIAIGKKVFARRKAEGFKEYQQYANWDDMIAHYNEQRNRQDTKRKSRLRDSKNSVLYKL